MPIEQEGREPKTISTAELIAGILANHRSYEDSRIRRPLPGKTTASVDLAGYLATHFDNRVLTVDVDSVLSAPPPARGRQEYTPVIIDCPPFSPLPAGGPVAEELLRGT